MKKLAAIKFIAIILLAFGITYLNFDDLSLKTNFKAYAALASGLVILTVAVVLRKKS